MPAKRTPFLVEIANRQRRLKIDRAAIRRAARTILADAGFREAQISVALVDDATIAGLHAEFMADPTPTDVLSFVLEADDGRLEGEVVASADTAAALAPRYGWPAEDELLLYVIHGLLHLVGYDDQTPAARAKMRRREKEVLAAVRGE